MSLQTISPQELFQLHQQGRNIDLIDVRTPAEFRQVHATLARNVPLDSLVPRDVIDARNGRADQPLYVICHSGTRAAKACEKFFGSGASNVISVDGGTQAWESAGLPVVRGQKAISLERQVRIAAGAIVVLGVALGYIHPAFFALSAMVGAGLMYSGITDSCWMGMMLAKMPWNRVSRGQACSA
jgi:rhodanese-related sulfurtransferase